MFQSTPVIANGRIARMGDVRAVTKSFNPRPLLLTGESVGGMIKEVVHKVSIHARYC